ncbi:G1 family glutamic endopeptidase [Plantactinospora sp. KBS50]|uniref:G1 family glutamic endopeptidase n=1 Tax=Plantactinospora sp. KBS50 TaxID=2024580 RepID=UPI0012FDCE19|nr:G1 family glutamic endopeptidase [Plantactinospora sp. KBS50]
MTGQETHGKARVRRCPPPPRNFDPFDAAEDDLRRHGLPLRPDPRTRPGVAALWERQARRYRGFEHLAAEFDPGTADRDVRAASALGPAPIESCGYELTSVAAPFTVLFVTWTVPNLRFVTSPFGVNHFHTFVGLGFLDVHVEMTVDSAQTVTSQLWAQGVGQINLPVGPGEVISGSLCLDTNAAGTAHYFLANETRGQTMNFSVDTGFPPAVTVNAGVTRGDLNLPVHPLARFGTVYFDEISAYTTSGTRSLTSGQAITMVESNGSTLATPVRLTDYAFKTVFAGA